MPTVVGPIPFGCHTLLTGIVEPIEFKTNFILERCRMIAKVLMSLTVAGCLLFCSGTEDKEVKPELEGVKCPLMAKKDVKESFAAEYNGAIFAFSSEENKAKFEANPAAYAPQYDGHCAYGVSKGGKVAGNPNLWRIIDNKLYLNITENVVMFWEEDIPGNINLAENNWASIESAPAKTGPIPQFTSAAPVN